MVVTHLLGEAAGPMLSPGAEGTPRVLAERTWLPRAAGLRPGPGKWERQRSQLCFLRHRGVFKACYFQVLIHFVKLKCRDLCQKSASSGLARGLNNPRGYSAVINGDVTLKLFSLFSLRDL